MKIFSCLTFQNLKNISLENQKKFRLQNFKRELFKCEMTLMLCILQNQIREIDEKLFCN